MVCPLLILLDKMKGKDQGGPIPHNLARLSTVRHPYSVAAPSTRGRLHILSFLRKWRLGEKGGAFLNDKKRRGGFRNL